MNYRAAHQADEDAIISWQPEPCIYCRLTTPAADWATQSAKIRWSMDGTMVGKETKSQLLSREYNAPAFPALVPAHARRRLALRLAHLDRHAYGSFRFAPSD